MFDLELQSVCWGGGGVQISFSSQSSAAPKIKYGSYNFHQDNAEYMPAKITAELKARFETRSGYSVAFQGKTLYFDLQCFSPLRSIDEY